MVHQKQMNRCLGVKGGGANNNSVFHQLFSFHPFINFKTLHWLTAMHSEENISHDIIFPDSCKLALKNIAILASRFFNLELFFGFFFIAHSGLYSTYLFIILIYKQRPWIPFRLCFKTVWETYTFTVKYIFHFPNSLRNLGK